MPKKPSNGTGEPAPELRLPLLTVADLSFAYPDGTVALDGVSFSVAEGQRVALIGPNGAGKSTLFRCLLGLELGFQGSIEVAGQTLNRKTLPAIRKVLGLVFQNPDHQLFMNTVLEDVAFGPLHQGLTAHDAASKAQEVLRSLGLEELYRKFPGNLSGGQKRLAAIAAVLAMEPRALLLDEPTSNLDHRGRRRVMELLPKVANTWIVATHDLGMVLETCNHVILLDKQRVQASGPPREVLAQVDLLERHGLEAPLGVRDRMGGSAP